MALTRKFLAALGIDNDKVDEIIQAHTDTVNGLMDEIEKYKADAEKLPAVEKELKELKPYNVLLLTGIASPDQMVLDLTPHVTSIAPLTFTDHHSYRKKDIRLLTQTFENMPSPKIIITTEKDAARLKSTEGMSEEVRKKIYALPVRISFMQDQEETFNENILGYVRKNSRNSILAKGKDDHKSGNGHHSGNRSRTISFRNH